MEILLTVQLSPA